MLRFSLAAVAGLSLICLAGCPSEPPANPPEDVSTDPPDVELPMDEPPPASDSKPGTDTTSQTPSQPQTEPKSAIEESTGPKPQTGSVTRKSFGKTPDGQEVDLYTLTNGNGAIVELTSYGAAVVSVQVPDRDGKLANVTLGFDNLEGYLNHTAHFGCTVGRYANRIAKGKFTLEDQEYQLATNSGENHLHGGIKAFDRVVWAADPFASGAGVKFNYVSADGEENYPGELDVTVTYSWNESNELKIEYVAFTTKPTILNLTNHCYWNLAGAGNGDILKHEVTLHADKYLLAAPDLIPTGELAPVAGTVMDFTKPKTIGAEIAALKEDGPGGYDHCYELRNKSGHMGLAARVKDPTSGRVMEIYTTQPGIQFYTGNFLKGEERNGGYPQHGGFCLETQHFPDSPNQPEFPSTVLKPGDIFQQRTVHRFVVE